MSSDAVVIGAGIIGAACARALAVAGFSVTVLDAAAPASGTSGQGEGNLLLSDKAAGPELDLARYSLLLWDRLRTELVDDLPADFPSIEYDRKGGLVVATTDEGRARLLDFASGQRGVGVAADPITADEARVREPDLNPDITAAVHYPDDAQVQPTIATEALLASARRHGAVIISGCRATAATTSGAKITGVRAGTDHYSTRLVINAAGPWAGEVATLLGTSIPVRPRRGVILVTAPMKQRIRHKVYDADYVGAVGSGAAALQISSVIESTAGGTVLVGSSRRQAGFDRSLDLAAITGIAAKATRIFPFLTQAAVLRSYGGYRPYLPDHLPAIGPDRRLRGLWHATGHEGAGIGLAPGTAALLTDLITGTRPAVDATGFRPDRPGLDPA